MVLYIKSSVTPVLGHIIRCILFACPTLNNVVTIIESAQFLHLKVSHQFFIVVLVDDPIIQSKQNNIVISNSIAYSLFISFFIF